MKVTVWDVQHGLAVWVQTPRNRDIVIDLGKGDFSRRDDAISPIEQMIHAGLHEIDQLILTHPHADHLRDLPAARTLPIHSIRFPELPEAAIRQGNQPQYKDLISQYLSFIAGYPDTAIEEPPATSPSVNGGVTFECFSPTFDGTGTINNASIVTFASFAGATICIPGDNEVASWESLIKLESFKNALRKTNVLVASHHGRENGYSNEMARLITPQLVVVSDGPATDTSAVSKYSQLASGYPVFSHSRGALGERKAVTTRNDGTIELIFGLGADGGPTLTVVVE